MMRVEGEIGVVADSRGPVSRAIEKAPTSYTSEFVLLLRREYESGRAARDIAKEYDLDRAAMMKHLRRSGVRIRNQGLTAEQAVRAAEMYLSGLTLAEVGAHFEVAQGTVRRCLILRGVRFRPALVKAHPSTESSSTDSARNGFAD